MFFSLMLLLCMTIWTVVTGEIKRTSLLRRFENWGKMSVLAMFIENNDCRESDLNIFLQKMTEYGVSR